MSTYGTPYKYHPDLSSACWAELPDGQQVECPDCDFRCSVDHLNPLKRLFERVQPGDTMPDGECPECGSACYANEPEAPIPEATPEQNVRAALRLLYQARDLLKKAKAPRATAKVRAAITSSQGAARNAAMAPYRKEREQAHA